MPKPDQIKPEVWTSKYKPLPTDEVTLPETGTEAQQLLRNFARYTFIALHESHYPENVQSIDACTNQVPYNPWFQGLLWIIQKSEEIQANQDRTSIINELQNLGLPFTREIIRLITTYLDSTSPTHTS